MQLVELGVFLPAMIVLVVCGCRKKSTKRRPPGQEGSRRAADLRMMFGSAPLRLTASNKHVFVEDAPLAGGKQSVTTQAANFATLHVAWTPRSQRSCISASQLGQVKATGSDLVRKTVRGHPGNMEMIRRGASQFA